MFLNYHMLLNNRTYHNLNKMLLMWLRLLFTVFLLMAGYFSKKHPSSEHPTNFDLVIISKRAHYFKSIWVVIHLFY